MAIKFSPALQAQFEDIIEKKIIDLSKSNFKGLSQYSSELKQRGVDVAYTMAARGIGGDLESIPEATLDSIANQAIEAIESEIAGVQVSILTGDEPKKTKRFRDSGKVRGISNGTSLPRGRGGKFLGALKLATLLNIMIKQEAASIMKNKTHGNTLNFRTGRLANSGTVTTVNMKTKSIYFQYMTKPYSVFQSDSGSRLATPGRDPRDIFANAIAEALSNLLSNRDLAETNFKLYHGRARYGNIQNGTLV